MILEWEIFWQRRRLNRMVSDGMPLCDPVVLTESRKMDELLKRWYRQRGISPNE